MKLDVCVFTHNPRRDVFKKALESIGRQTLARDLFHVWVIDNASNPPLNANDMLPLQQGGVSYTLVQELKLGLAHGRVRAIESTTGEWMVLVDDDNELFDDYLANVRDIVMTTPNLGCFGGKLLLPKYIQVPQWMVPLIPFLAIKDEGDEVITNCVDKWGPWEPPGAGSVIRRPVLQLFLQRFREFDDAARLGRRGKKGLMSAEDSMMLRGAWRLNLSCSYQPRLKLWHHIDTRRLDFRYFVRLLFNYGRSYVVLERSLGNEVAPATLRDLWRILTNFPRSREKTVRLAWQWGHFFESRRANPACAPIALKNPLIETKSVQKTECTQV